MDLDARILNFECRYPEIAESAWVAPGATVVGDVRLGERSSVWYGAVLRGDTDPITVGARTNIQDGAILRANLGFPATVGDGCVVGHRRSCTAAPSRTAP